MDYKYLLILLVACNTSPKVKVCIVEDTHGYCNYGDVATKQAYPEDMKDYVAFGDEGLDLFTSRKEQCLLRGSLPPTQNTLREMEPCVIQPTKKTLTEMPTCESAVGMIAVDRRSWGKMKNFFSYCGESTR